MYKTWVMMTSKSVCARPLLNQSLHGYVKKLEGKISLLMISMPDSSIAGFGFNTLMGPLVG